MDVSDLLGLSEPLTKLIETVSCGVGKVYEPIHLTRMAKAKAKEIELIGNALEHNLLLPSSFEADGIKIDAMESEELIKRAGKRFLFQEVKKQHNIDCVVNAAYNELKSKESVSKEPVDDDWITSFFDFIANVSNAGMQVLWGKILSGEIEKPGSFSIRTLQAVRTLSQRDAEIFQHILPLIMRMSNATFFLTSNNDILAKYDAQFSDILALEDAGLIKADANTSLTMTIGNSRKSGRVIYNPPYLALFIGQGSDITPISYGIYVLTRAGRELYSILSHTGNFNYICDVASDFLKNNLNIGECFIHSIKSINEDNISYDMDILAEYHND